MILDERQQVIAELAISKRVWVRVKRAMMETLGYMKVLMRRSGR